MPTCSKCGRKGLTLKCDSNGFCNECGRNMLAEAEARKREEVRRNNYYACREKRARHNVQRIYDAFISKYPDALITGIGVHADGDKLLIYLDGQPAYYATFNALTSSADLVKYVDPSLVPMNSQTSKNSSGCLSALLIVLGLFLFLICLVGLGSSGDTGDTAKVTVAPTATAAADDLEPWAKYYAMRNMPKDVDITNVLCVKYDDNTSNITVLCTMDVMHSDKDYLRSAADLIHGFLEDISHRDDVHNVTVVFYGPFIDSFGNDVTSTSVRVEYNMKTIKRINYDYFERKLYSDPESIIKVADYYMIHPAYQD